MEKRGCLGDSQGEKTGMSGEGWSGGRGKGPRPGRQRRHAVLLNQPPNIPDSLQATSHIPKQGCSGWDQDGEAEVKRRTPAGRGLEICSQGQWLRDQDGSQNFHPQTSTIPSTRRLKQVQERRGTVSAAPSRGLGKGDGLKLGISRAGPGRGGECSKRWGPRAPAGGAGTYKAAEHGAGDAGGQAHGRGRSGPAHMSPEPLRCPPVPGARRIPAAGPARCSRGGQETSALAAGPPRDSRALLPSFPQWSELSSALPHERRREGSQARGVSGTAPGRRARGGSSEPGPQLQAPPSPQPLSCLGGRPSGNV